MGYVLVGDAAELVFVLGKKTPPSSLGDTDVFLLYGTFCFRYQDTYKYAQSLELFLCRETPG